MAINVSVQHNGGFLPGIILLTQCYYHRGTRFNAMKRFLYLQPMIPPKRFDIFPPDWGMHQKVYMRSDFSLNNIDYRRFLLYYTSASTFVVVVVVVAHIQRIGCQLEKNYFTRWPIPLVVC